MVLRKVMKVTVRSTVKTPIMNWDCFLDMSLITYSSDVVKTAENESSRISASRAFYYSCLELFDLSLLCERVEMLPEFRLFLVPEDVCIVADYGYLVRGISRLEN